MEDNNQAREALTPHRIRWLPTTARPGRPILPPREVCLYLPCYPLPSPLSGCSSSHLPAEDDDPRPLTWGRLHYRTEATDGKRTNELRGKEQEGKGKFARIDESCRSPARIGAPVPARYIAAHPPSSCSSEWGLVSFQSSPVSLA
jgi:hypothetical protein